MTTQTIERKPVLNSLLTAKSLSKFFSVLALVLMPIRPVMIAVSCLVLADFITGVWASIKEGKRITSAGFKKTVVKSLIYQLVIVVSFIIESYLMEGIPAVKVVAGLIALTEGKSFFENVHRITGVDYWAKLMSVAQANLKELPKDEDKK